MGSGPGSRRVQDQGSTRQGFVCRQCLSCGPARPVLYDCGACPQSTGREAVMLSVLCCDHIANAFCGYEGCVYTAACCELRVYRPVCTRAHTLDQPSRGVIHQRALACAEFSPNSGDSQRRKKKVGSGRMKLKTKKNVRPWGTHMGARYRLHTHLSTARSELASRLVLVLVVQP